MNTFLLINIRTFCRVSYYILKKNLEKFSLYRGVGCIILFSYIYSYMQPLDKNTLFAIFDQGDEEVYQEHNITGVMDNPYVLIGMVIRGMENFHLMDLMYKRSYPEQYKEVRETIKMNYMSKLVGYLERLDVNKFETVYTIGDSYESKTVMRALTALIKYFEDIEYYEKCATIKKYIDLLSHEIVEKELLK